MLSCQHRRYLKQLIILLSILVIVFNVVMYRIKWWPLLLSNQKMQSIIKMQLTHDVLSNEYKETALDRQWLQVSILSKNKIKKLFLDSFKTSSVLLQRLSFGEAKKEGLLKRQPVSVVVGGSYTQVLRFLIALANVKLVASIDQLSVSYRDNLHVLQIDLGVIVP